MLLCGTDIWRGRLWDGAERRLSRKLLKEGSRDGSEILKGEYGRHPGEEARCNICLAALTQTQFSSQNDFIEHVWQKHFFFLNLRCFRIVRRFGILVFLHLETKTRPVASHSEFDLCSFCSPICRPLTIFFIKVYFSFLLGNDLVFWVLFPFFKMTTFLHF